MWVHVSVRVSGRVRARGRVTRVTRVTFTSVRITYVARVRVRVSARLRVRLRGNCVWVHVRSLGCVRDG